MWLIIVVGVIVAAAAYPAYWYLSEPLKSDIYLHGDILMRGLRDGSVPWYTVFYALLWAGVLGRHVELYDELRVPAAVILAAAMGGKAAAVVWALRRARAPVIATLLATLFTLVVVPLKLSSADTFYLGRITPSIWHNSTTVLLMPVSIVLFVVALDVLRREHARWFATAGVVGLLVVNIMVKPNFGMVFLPVFGIYALVLAVHRRKSSGWWRPLSRYLWLAVAGIVVLLLQYWGTYANGSVQYANTFDPLAVWRILARGNITLAIFESLLLPVIATIVLWRAARDRTAMVLSWCCLLLGMTLFALLSEVNLATGRTLTHGNWSWGMQVAMFVLIVVLVREWLQQRHELRLEPKLIVYALAAIQFVTGILYLIRLFTVSYT